jgi:hypothetical protein
MARQVESLAGQAFAENALGHTFVAFGEFGSALAHAREAQARHGGHPGIYQTLTKLKF